MKTKHLIPLALVLAIAALPACSLESHPIKGADGHSYRVVRQGVDRGPGKVSDATVYERRGDTNRLYILQLGSAEHNGTFISIAK